MQDLIRASADLISASNFAVVFTGAGISTASGIPDFRSPDSGLWEKYDPSVASLLTFKHYPEKFFDWIKPLFLQSQNAGPNPAHTYISRMEQEGFIKAIITQNIDGLHQKSGASNVIELHGSAKSATCTKCKIKIPTGEMMHIFTQTSEIPKCVECGSVIKPDVILFDELLPEKAWQEACAVIDKADLVLVVGSSLSVYPAASLPITAYRKGAKIIINTLDATENDYIAEVLIRERCEIVVPEIYKQLTN